MTKQMSGLAGNTGFVLPVNVMSSTLFTVKSDTHKACNLCGFSLVMV